MGVDDGGAQLVGAEEVVRAGVRRHQQFEVVRNGVFGELFRDAKSAVRYEDQDRIFLHLPECVRGSLEASSFLQFPL